MTIDRNSIHTDGRNRAAIGRDRLSGMTLIELLTTITIIAILTTIALPPLRTLQGRQALISGQRTVQAALYRLQQLTYSPPQLQDSDDYRVLGFGLGFFQKNGQVALGSGSSACVVNNPSNDFMALIKYYTIKSNGNGKINAIFNGVTDPAAPCPQNITPANYPNDIFLLPRGIIFDGTNASQQPEMPWLLTRPLVAVDSQYSSLLTIDNIPDTNIFADLGSYTSITLQLANPSLKVNGHVLCRGVVVSNSSAGYDTSTGIIQGCP